MADDKILRFTEKKQDHIHNLHEKKLQDMRQAFEKALPLTKSTSYSKKRTKKKK